MTTKVRRQATKVQKALSPSRVSRVSEPVPWQKSPIVLIEHSVNRASYIRTPTISSGTNIRFKRIVRRRNPLHKKCTNV